MNNIETKKVKDIEIWDGKKYTSVETVQRYPKDAKVLKMTTENGFSCVMKHSHPSWCMITRNDVGESVVPFSELMNKWVLTEKGYSKVVSLEEVEYEGFLYDVSTVTKAYEADGIRTHNSFHCTSEDSLVFVRSASTGFVCCTLKELFNIGAAKEYYYEGKEYKKVYGLEILTHYGWKKLKKICRHKPDSEMIAVSDGRTILICQDNHPIGFTQNKNICKVCGYHRLVKSSKGYKKQNMWRCTKCWKMQEPYFYSGAEDVEFKEATDLKSETDMIMTNLSILDSDQILEGVIPSHDPYIVGMFITEGNCNFSKGKGQKTTVNDLAIPVSIALHQNPGRIYDKILNRLEKVFGPSRINKHRGKTLTISGRDLAEEFHELYGRYSWNKHLPADFIHYPKEWLVTFLCAVIEGDGCIAKRKQGKGTTTIVIDTVSYSFLQQLHIICKKLGFVSTMLLTPNREKTKWQGFRLNITLTQEVQETLKDCIKLEGITVFSPPQKGALKDHQNFCYTKPVIYNREYVYDVTTEDGTVLICGVTTHNSGGIATGRGVQSVSALQRAQQLFNMPKTLPNSAVLAKHSGTVSRIEKDPSTNGHYIFVKAEKDEHKHYVPPSRELLIKAGDDISRGDSLSDGVINPRQLLQYKNMDAVRDYLTDQLHSIYKNVGGTRRRNVEVVVKNLTNLTEVHDPGKSEHLTGDILPLNKVQEFNALAKPEDKIIHAPILRGIKETALLKDEDYLSRMNFQRIQSTLVEGAGKGWKTTTKNTTNPIPAFAASTITPQTDKNKPHY